MPKAKKADERMGERVSEGDRERGRVGERDGVKRKEAKKRERVKELQKTLFFLGCTQVSFFLSSFLTTHPCLCIKGSFLLSVSGHLVE